MNEDIAGRYIRKKSRSHYIELKADGTYFLFEGAAVLSGTYEVEGTEIIIGSAGSSSRGRIQDGVITDSEGDKWVRAKDGAASGDEPPAFLSWIPVLREDIPWELIDIGVILVIFVLLGVTRR